VFEKVSKQIEHTSLYSCNCSFVADSSELILLLALLLRRKFFQPSTARAYTLKYAWMKMMNVPAKVTIIYSEDDYIKYCTNNDNNYNYITG